MTNLVDLHTHSTASDGQYHPAELVEKARQAGVTLLALTDHDTLGGLDEAVRAACCLYDGEKKRLLLCYEGEAEPAALAKSLRAKLPPYMAPNGIHRLEALPRTPNGKMDRRALLERARNGTL